MTGIHNETDEPPEDGFRLTVSLSGLWNFFKDRRIKRDLNNIKKHYDFDKENEDELHNNDSIGIDSSASGDH